MKRSSIIRTRIATAGLAGVLGVAAVVLTGRNQPHSPSAHIVVAPTTRAAPRTTPALTSGPVLTDASVRTVLDETYGHGANGSRSGCDVDGAVGATGTCPFTPRLKAQLDHLSRWTPSPNAVLNVCNYSLISGIQGGFTTPLSETHTITGGSATATVTIHDQPVVTLTIIDSNGSTLVDDIADDLAGQRSVYDLNCLWPPGAH